jgi:hypothetical protein
VCPFFHNFLHPHLGHFSGSCISILSAVKVSDRTLRRLIFRSNIPAPTKLFACKTTPLKKKKGKVAAEKT